MIEGTNDQNKMMMKKPDDANLDVRIKNMITIKKNVLLNKE